MFNVVFAAFAVFGIMAVVALFIFLLLWIEAGKKADTWENTPFGEIDEEKLK